MCRIAFFQRKTRVARRNAPRLRAEERDISAREIAGVAFAEARFTHVPADVGSHRHLDIDVAQTVEGIAVRVDLRQERVIRPAYDGRLRHYAGGIRDVEQRTA